MWHRRNAELAETKSIESDYVLFHLKFHCSEGGNGDETSGRTGLLTIPKEA